MQRQNKTYDTWRLRVPSVETVQSWVAKAVVEGQRLGEGLPEQVLLEVVVRLWEGLGEDHGEVPVVEAGWLEEREAAIAMVLGHKVPPVVSHHMLKLRVRMAMVLERRRG